MAVYTLGIWRVKTGHENDFVAAWKKLADRTRADLPQATATLLRDREDPSLFVSSGPWESVEQVDAWRSSSAFTSSIAAIREHVEDFEPHTMDLAVDIS
ncbi:putative quinol monooxygenase [Aeromicrobium sp.]|uniref:putative quinol monooxygenase n=1 Tax=Aeromicrobium sp. TaxID=1871063 RepID=UPI003C6380A1